jgi:hypothetical protein
MTREEGKTLPESRPCAAAAGARRNRMGHGAGSHHPAALAQTRRRSASHGAAHLGALLARLSLEISVCRGLASPAVLNPVRHPTERPSEKASAACRPNHAKRGRCCPKTRLRSGFAPARLLAAMQCQKHPSSQKPVRCEIRFRKRGGDPLPSLFSAGRPCRNCFP